MVASNIPAGVHQVEFKPLHEWTTPKPLAVHVTGFRTVSNVATYVSAPLEGFLVGQIPTQFIYRGESKVLKVRNPVGSTEVALIAIDPWPLAGTYTYTPASGIFDPN